MIRVNHDETKGREGNCSAIKPARAVIAAASWAEPGTVSEEAVKRAVVMFGRPAPKHLFYFGKFKTRESQDLASARTCYSKGWWFVMVFWVKGECKALKANLPPSSPSSLSPGAGRRNQNFFFSRWLRETKIPSPRNRARKPRKTLTSALKTLTPYRSCSILCWLLPSLVLVGLSSFFLFPFACACVCALLVHRFASCRLGKIRPRKLTNN